MLIRSREISCKFRTLFDSWMSDDLTSMEGGGWSSFGYLSCQQQLDTQEMPSQWFGFARIVTLFTTTSQVCRWIQSYVWELMNAYKSLWDPQMKGAVWVQSITNDGAHLTNQIIPESKPCPGDKFTNSKSCFQHFRWKAVIIDNSSAGCLSNSRIILLAHVLGRVWTSYRISTSVFIESITCFIESTSQGWRGPAAFAH